MYKDTDFRPKMGQTSSLYSSFNTQPNFAPILKLLVIMITDDAMLEKYPLDDVQKAIVRSPSIMKMMMDPGDSAGDSDFSVILNGMAKNDVKISE